MNCLCLIMSSRFESIMIISLFIINTASNCLTAVCTLKWQCMTSYDIIVKGYDIISVQKCRGRFWRHLLVDKNGNKCDICVKKYCIFRGDPSDQCFFFKVAKILKQNVQSSCQLADHVEIS